MGYATKSNVMQFKTFSVCAGLDISTTGNSCGGFHQATSKDTQLWFESGECNMYGNCSRSRCCQIIIFVGPSDLMTSMTSFRTCRANGGQCQGICSKALCIADDSLRKLGRLGRRLCKYLQASKMKRLIYLLMSFEIIQKYCLERF